MSFTYRTPQLLQEDHQTTLDVIERLDALLAKARRSPPDVNDATVRSTLKKAAEAIGAEVEFHFKFEEDELFPRLEEAGDVGIGMHLREEHAALLPLGLAIAKGAGEAIDSGFTQAGWDDFRDKAGELIERMLAHIQKEEMALLPMLDELLDDESDMELSVQHGNAH
ncbi:MAG: hemerythrin domain-containing protein [Rhodobacteraceae bacterium]|nr:hemerythrin domain-containing protein [Paracoccaceae bacterium]